MVLSIINRRPTQFEGTQRVWPNLRQPYALWLLADWTLNMVSGWCLQSPHSATHNIFSFVWFVHYFFFPIDVAWTLFLQLLRRASQSRFCHKSSCACIAVIGQWCPRAQHTNRQSVRRDGFHLTPHIIYSLITEYIQNPEIELRQAYFFPTQHTHRQTV